MFERSDRALDVAAAAALALIAVGSVFKTPAAERFGPVCLSLAALNATAAVLFLRRRPARVEGTTAAILASIPGVLVGAFAFVVAPPVLTWPLVPKVMVIVGAAFAILSLATLGKSFSILPAARDVVTTGPYRWVRHPAYLGELVVVAAASIARRDLAGAAVFAIATSAVVVRILLEEHLLGTDEAYSAYVKKVRFRLVYGLW